MFCLVLLLELFFPMTIATDRIKHERITLLYTSSVVEFSRFMLHAHQDLCCHGEGSTSLVWLHWTLLGAVTCGGSRRGVVEQWLWHLASHYRLALPSILMANIQSLENKMDDLLCRLVTQCYFRYCSVLYFCKTWLNQKTPNKTITPADYTAYRCNRNLEECNTKEGYGCPCQLIVVYRH